MVPGRAGRRRPPTARFCTRLHVECRVQQLTGSWPPGGALAVVGAPAGRGGPRAGGAAAAGSQSGTRRCPRSWRSAGSGPGTSPPSARQTLRSGAAAPPQLWRFPPWRAQPRWPTSAVLPPGEPAYKAYMVHNRHRLTGQACWHAHMLSPPRQCPRSCARPSKRCAATDFKNHEIDRQGAPRIRGFCVPHKRSFCVDEEQGTRAGALPAAGP